MVIYDNNHYEWVDLAELLAEQGCSVSLVTPAPLISSWSQFTLEQERIESQVDEVGREVVSADGVRVIKMDAVTLSNTVSGMKLSCRAMAWCW